MNKYKIEKFDWDENYLNCLWCDGIVASIHTKEGEYHLFVVGDVRCNLITKTNIISDGDEIPKGTIIAYVKGNGTGFYHEMSRYIKDDEELDRIISGEHPLYELDFKNNNWIELDYLKDNGEYEGLDILLDSCMINEALNEAMTMISKLEKDRKKVEGIEI